MDFVVVVPYRDGGDDLTRLLATLPGGVRVVVVDDMSTIPPRPPHRDDIQVDVVRLPSRGYFSGAVNEGIRQAGNLDVVVLNQDVYFTDPATLFHVVEVSRRGGYAIAGDGVFPRSWPSGYVQGTVMYLARKALDRVGLLNESDWPLWGATCEWQLRACRLGFTANPMRLGDGVVHSREGGFGRAIRETLREGKPRDWLIRIPPLVSVVVPVFNYGKYLHDAVASLVGGSTSLGYHPGQTFAAFEVILVDDASTDDSWEIMLGLASPWKGIRCIHRETRGGTAAAYNTGSKAAYGKFLQFLDADDMLEATALERYYRVAEANPNAVVYSNLRKFGYGKRGNVMLLPDYDFERLLHKNHVPVGVMVAKDAWARVGGVPEEFGDGRQDWAFAVALGQQGVCGIRLEDPLYLYRRENHNRTLTNSNGQWKERMMRVFGPLYGGVRTMGCCGSRRRALLPVRGAARAGESPSGLVELEYVGLNWGTQTWVGKEVVYQFGLSRPRGYVLAGDVETLLRYTEGGKPCFRRVPKSGDGPDEAVSSQTPDPDLLTVGDIRKLVQQLSDEQRRAMAVAERAGKGRKGVLRLLER